MDRTQPAPAPSSRRRQLLLGLATLPAGAWAAPGPALGVGVLSVPPWAIPGEHGDWAGVGVDLVKAVSNDSGVALHTVVVPFARSKLMLLGGEIAIMLAYENTHFPHAATTAGPLSEDDIVLITGQRKTALHTIGCVRGTQHLFNLDLGQPFVNYETSSYEQGINMLMRERLDAVIMPGVALPYTLKKLKLEPSQLGSVQVVKRSKLMLYISPSVLTPALKERLDSACKRLHGEQTLKQLFKRYA